MYEFEHILNGRGSLQHHEEMAEWVQREALARIAHEGSLRTRHTASESGAPLAVRQSSWFWGQKWRLFSALKHELVMLRHP